LRDSFARAFESQLSLFPGILITGDLGFGVFDELARNHSDKFLNAGITEQSLTSMAAGIADEGFIPFIYSIANFPTFRNLEQIRNDIAYPGKHVVVTSVGAGLSYGTLGFSHFGVEDLAIMRSLPNMRILSPSDPLRSRLATFSAFAVASPTYLRLGKNGEKNFGEDGQIEHKAIRPIVKEGNAVAVLSTGSIGSRVESTQKDLLTPVDHFSIEEVWPVGEELWGLISSYDHVIVVEEHSPIGGLYTMLAEGCSLRSIRTRLSSCAIDRTRLITAGDHDYMLDQAGLSVSSISAKIASVL
jgi:transketolase